MKYFIGNWKMFGVPKSISILKKLNKFASSDKNKKQIQSDCHSTIHSH